MMAGGAVYSTEYKENERASLNAGEEQSVRMCEQEGKNERPRVRERVHLINSPGISGRPASPTIPWDITQSSSGRFCP